MINHEAVDALIAAVSRLQTAVGALEARTDRHSFKECHDAMEEQRQAIDDAKLMPAGPAQERQMKAAQGMIDRAKVEQQMGGYNLLLVVEYSPAVHELTTRVVDMAAAVEEAAK
jgi:hypothetical protein